jgi:probable F420-dependent oxidoreductase
VAHDRRFRFGIQLHRPLDGSTWLDSARRVEELGYSTLFVPDHFGDQLAPLTALASAAAVTKTLNVGALVFDNDYRHPLVLAKEIATLDAISNGRVEFGLGAGWMRTDYVESGIAYDEPGTRVQRFMEGVDVIRGVWSGEPFDHAGTHYRITAHSGLPVPVTAGGPRLLIGGGSPRMLRYAGANADIVGVNPSIHSGAIDADAARDAAADRFDRKVGWVREGAGDRFDDIELNVLVFFASVTDDRAGLAAGVAPMFGIDPTDVLTTPAVVAGTVDEICASLEVNRDRWGVSYVVFQQDAIEAMAPVVERLSGS